MYSSNALAWGSRRRLSLVVPNGTIIELINDLSVYELRKKTNHIEEVITLLSSPAMIASH